MNWKHVAVILLLAFSVGVMFAVKPPNSAEAASNSQSSQFIEEFSVPTARSGPFPIEIDQQGTVWFAEDNASKLAKFFPENKSFVEYPLPRFSKNLWGLAVDKNGTVWLTAWDINAILNFNPQTATFREFPVPTAHANPLEVIVASDGQVWFTEFNASKIAKLTPSSGQIEEFQVSTGNVGTSGIIEDPKGNIWFTESFAGKVGQFNKTTREFIAYTPPFRVFSPVGIAIDNNGVLWIADHGSNHFFTFNPATNEWALFDTGAPKREIYPVTIPNQLKIDARGNIWFSEHGGNRIGRFDPRSKTLTEYWIPSVISITFWLDVDKKGDVWFTEWNFGKIGVVKASENIPFTLNVSPLTARISAGEQTTFDIDTAGTPGYSNRLIMNVTGLERNMTATFDRNIVQLSNSQPSKARFTFQAKPTLSPGKYNLTVSANDGSIIRGAVVTLDVTPVQVARPFDAVTVSLIAVGIVAGGTIGFFFSRRSKKPKFQPAPRPQRPRVPPQSRKRRK